MNILKLIAKLIKFGKKAAPVVKEVGDVVDAVKAATKKKGV